MFEQIGLMNRDSRARKYCVFLHESEEYGEDDDVKQLKRYNINDSRNSDNTESLLSKRVGDKNNKV